MRILPRIAGWWPLHVCLFHALFVCVACSGNVNAVTAKLELDNSTNDYAFLYEGLRLEFVYIDDLSAWISKYEITINEYCAYDANYRHDSADYVGFSDRWPAFNISAAAALRFADWLNKGARSILPKGYAFRLPTTDEWRWVARCGGDRIYPWGNSWPPCKMKDGYWGNYFGEENLDVAISKRLAPRENIEAREVPDNYTQCIKNYNDTYINLAPVDQSGMNEYGVFGLGGNIEEWAYSAERNDYVLVGANFCMSKPLFLNLNYEYSISPKPHPMLPLVKDKQSDYGTGFRVMLAKEVK